MPPSRVAVSMKGYIGDTVMALPLLGSLQSQLGEGHLKILAPTIVSDVLGETWSERFIQLSAKRGLKSLAEQVRVLKSLQPEAVILVNRSFRSALAAWLSRVPVRVGHATEGRATLLTKSLPYGPHEPEAECYAKLAALAGFSSVESYVPCLSVSQDEKEHGRQIVSQFPDPSKVIAIQPGARHEDKSLPKMVVVEVIQNLSSRGFRPILVGGADETAVAQQVLAKTNATNLVGKLSLRQTIGLLANLAFVIGADTGMMHLAAAVHTPTVTVFGPNSAKKWGHHYVPHKVLAAPDGKMAKVTADEIIAAVGVS